MRSKFVSLLFTFLCLSSSLLRVMTKMVIDCGGKSAPQFPDTRVQHFKSRSMTAFCADPVIGFGLVCGEVAQRIDLVYPDIYTSLLTDAINYHWYDLLGNCYEYCQCIDIMPETPDRHREAANFQTHVDEISITSSDQQGGDAMYYCSEHLHGSPLHDDCENVLDDVKSEISHSVRASQELEVNIGSSNKTWFRGPGKTPAPNQASNLPTLDLPKTYSKGSCKMTLFFENYRDAEEESWNDLLSVTGDLVDICASKRHAGGMASQDSHSIKISIYELDSVQDRMIQLKAGLVLDRSGDAIIDNLDSDLKQPDQDLPAGSSISLATNEAQGACNSSKSSNCRTPCYSHKDCNTSEDYVCALLGVGDLPITTSWEDFRCTFVRNAAALIKLTAQSAVCSTGRCLLDADGTLFVPGAASDVTWDRGKTTTEGRNQSNTNSTLSQLSQNRNVGFNTNSNVTISHQNSTHGHYPAYSLFCPCNCTYVSMACCSSNITIEDSKYKINMTLPSQNSTMTCDMSGGGWVSATDETRMPTATSSTGVMGDTNITSDHPGSSPAEIDHSSTSPSPSFEGVVPVQSGYSYSFKELDHLSEDNNDTLPGVN